MKKLSILLLFFFLGLNAEAQRRRLVEVDADTLTKPSSPSLVGIASANQTFYLVPYSGVPIRMARYSELQNFISQLTNKENAFSKNTAFNKSFGTSPGTVLEGNYVPSWISISGKPTSFAGYGLTESDPLWLTKWDSVRSQGFSVDNILIDDAFVSDGTADFSQATINSLYTSEIELDVGGTGSQGEVIKMKGGLKWDSLNVEEVRGISSYIKADTSDGRAVLQLPDHVALMIPDSSHLVVEPDYIRAWQINGAFGNVPLDYDHIVVGLDSTELTFPKPNYNKRWTVSCSCFDNLQYGYDSVALPYLNKNTGDSKGKLMPQSILYFADTVWVQDRNAEVFSNYYSTEHERSKFTARSAYFGFDIIWDNSQKRFILQ